MTREEAIEWMIFQKEQSLAMSDGKPGTLTAAYDMAIEALSAEAVQGECRTCKRSSDYLWKNGENGTKCPIEEHYALPKDGYCHLHEPYKGGDDE